MTRHRPFLQRQIVSVALLGCIIFFMLGTVSLMRSSPLPKEALSPPTQQLSKRSYSEVSDALVLLVQQKGAKAALMDIRARMRSDDQVLRSCHAFVHRIGQEAYKKYGDFAEAVSYQDEICNAGYLHGIIEARFSQEKHIFAALESICAPYDDKTLLGWECYHGVDHGLMYYTNNNLPQALAFCDSFKKDSQSSSCANGVFMENFAADASIHPSKYLKAQDPLYPCYEQQDRHKKDCYIYAPTYFLHLHENAYQESLAWCETAERDYREVCVYGVGTQAMKENINHPHFVESLCLQAKGDFLQACVVGMVSLYMNHFGSLQEGKQLCIQLGTRTKSFCEAAVMDREKNREF